MTCATRRFDAGRAASAVLPTTIRASCHCARLASTARPAAEFVQVHVAPETEALLGERLDAFGEQANRLASAAWAGRA
jgi:hypothetical protein